MATYHVTKSGNDNNNGLTEGAAFLTINKATSVAGGGDTVIVYEGTYAEKVVTGASGASGNKVTFRVNNGDTVTIQGATGQDYLIDINHPYNVWQGFKCNPNGDYKSDRQALIDISSNAHHTELDNINIFGYTDWEAVSTRVGGIQCNADSCSFTTCYVANTRFHCIKFDEGVNDWLIDSMETTYHGYNGVMQNNSTKDNIKIIRGLCINSILAGSDGSDGFQLNGVGGANPDTIPTLRNVVIRDTICHNNGENGIDMKGAAYVLIERCIAYNNRGDNDGAGNRTTGDGLAAQSNNAQNYSQNIIYRYNIVYDNWKGIRASFDSRNIHTYNNTIINNTHDYTGPNSTFVSSSDGVPYGVGNSGMGGSYNGIKNNIIGYHTKAEIAYELARTVDIDGQLYLATDTGADHFVNRSGGVTYYTFAEWQTALQAAGNVTGEDANSSITSTSPFIAGITSTINGETAWSDWALSGVNSAAYQAGVHLTRANGSGTSSVNLVVDDSGYFYDSYDITNEVGDTIYVGGVQARVASVNSDTSITLENPISWDDNALIYFNTTTPNIGATDIGATEDNETVPFYINCGSESAYSGWNTYGADRNSTGGNTGSWIADIANTTDDELYYTRRSMAGGESFSYSFNVANGNYWVALHTREQFYSTAGQRLFDITINGTEVETNFDIVAESGGRHTAFVKLYAVTVADGLLDITVSAGSGGTGSNDGLLNAIAVFANTADVTAPTFSGAQTATYSEGQVTVTWNEPTDATPSSLIKFNVYELGSYDTPVKSVYGSSSATFAVTGSGTKSYVVRAEDADGNEDTNTTAVSVVLSPTKSRLERHKSAVARGNVIPGRFPMFRS